MIYFHYCQSFINEVDKLTLDFVTKLLDGYTNRNTLKGVGRVSSFTGKIYVLLLKNPTHIEVIIQEKSLEIDGKDVTVYFVRGLKKGLSDYVSIRDGKWLKYNVLDNNDIHDFEKTYSNFNLPIKEYKMNLPEHLLTWQSEYKLSIRFNILESEEWVKFSMSNSRDDGMQIEKSELFKLLLIDITDDQVKIKDSDTELIDKFSEDISLFKSSMNEVGIVYFKITIINRTYFLLLNGARLDTQKSHWEKIIRSDKYKNKIDLTNYEALCRVSLKAYPNWTLKIPDLWLKIEKNSEIGNLSLLPEQTGFLNNFKFPKYINGQAGSGKSTMLYYLFANSYYYKYADSIKGDIIFLTENEKLLEHTKKSVRELLSYNPEFIHLTSEEIAISNFDKHFFSFKNFLLSFLPDTNSIYNDEEKYIDFPRFKDLYSKSQITNTIKKNFSAEYVWFILSTYIYGYDLNEIITSENYDERMPKEGKRLISFENFKKVENDIIKPYYEKWLNEQGYWDKIKLIKHINRNISIKKHFEVIFCDEAQDFSRVELEFILKLSEYSKFKLGNLPQFPIVFAGDPLQTVNPTGFKTEVLTSMVYEELNNLGYNFDQKNLVYEPEYNYRSSQTIVNLANIIQYERKTNLNAEINKKQVSKRPNFYKYENINIFIDENILKENTDLQNKIRLKTIIVPVNTNEIDEYKVHNPILENFNEIISAVDAKGIDFSEVVIFKFGEYYDKIGENDYEKQFFFNKLYVAITRAQQELLIVDDVSSKNNFWRSLIDKYISSEWNTSENRISSIDDVLIMDINKVKQSEPKDILEDANRSREQAKITNNKALLTLSASNFFKLGHLKEYYLCLGDIEMIDTNWIKAAEYYLNKQVGDYGLEMASEAYLKGKEWKKLLELSELINNDDSVVKKLIAKLFSDSFLNEEDIDKLFDNKLQVKNLLDKTTWRIQYFDKLKLLYRSVSFDQKIKVLHIIDGITRIEDKDYKRFIIIEFFNIKQYDSAVQVCEQFGIDYENDEKDLILIYCMSNLEIAKRKSDFENIIIWLGRIAIESNVNKTEYASEIISYYHKFKDRVDSSDNSYVLLYVYFSSIILGKLNEILYFSKVVEANFKNNNNEIGLAEEYLRFLQKNKIESSIQNFVLERYAKNALLGGTLLDHINSSYKQLSSNLDSSYIPFTVEELNNIDAIPEGISNSISQHFKSMRIKNFKLFRELNIENLGLFNLVVGDNNIGKTSFLESMLFTPNYDQYLERLAFAYIERANILPDKEPDSIEINYYYKIPKNFLNEFSHNNSEKNIIEYEFVDGRNISKCVVDFNLFDIKILDSLSFQRSIEMPFLPYGKGFGLDLAQVYLNEIDKKKNLRQEFLINMNLFIPGIERVIADTESKNIFIELSNSESTYSLQQFGEGANKLFRILVLLTKHKGKLLLIDEIDAGIHYSRFKDFWLIILRIALKDNTQLVVTTHNDECIKFFYNSLEKLGCEYSKESRVVQLEKMNNNITAYTLDYDSLKLSVLDKLEIRGERNEEN